MFFFLASALYNQMKIALLIFK